MAMSSVHCSCDIFGAFRRVVLSFEKNKYIYIYIANAFTRGYHADGCLTRATRNIRVRRRLDRHATRVQLCAKVAAVDKTERTMDGCAGLDSKLGLALPNASATTQKYVVRNI